MFLYLSFHVEIVFIVIHKDIKVVLFWIKQKEMLRKLGFLALREVRSIFCRDFLYEIVRKNDR